MSALLIIFIYYVCPRTFKKPGFDYDGTATPYDKAGIFTGSVTIVDGVPVATYPGEPGDNWCDASPLNLSDPLVSGAVTSQVSSGS